MKITREVILDLWSAYTADEASSDTRILVEEFLQQDPEFAQLLKGQDEMKLLKSAVPALPPDQEVQALNQTKRQLHGLDWSLVLLLEAMLFTALAFARIVSDTSWDVSPRNFIITASLAALVWCAYILRLMWVRRKFYQKPAKNN